MERRIKSLRNTGLEAVITILKAGIKLSELKINDSSKYIRKVRLYNKQNHHSEICNNRITALRTEITLPESKSPVT